jgi:hypothetical protein
VADPEDPHRWHKTASTSLPKPNTQQLKTLGSAQAAPPVSSDTFPTVVITRMANSTAHAAA